MILALSEKVEDNIKHTSTVDQRENLLFGQLILGEATPHHMYWCSQAIFDLSLHSNPNRVTITPYFNTTSTLLSKRSLQHSHFNTVCRRRRPWRPSVWAAGCSYHPRNWLFYMTSQGNTSPPGTQPPLEVNQLYSIQFKSPTFQTRFQKTFENFKICTIYHISWFVCCGSNWWETLFILNYPSTSV